MSYTPSFVCFSIALLSWPQATRMTHILIYLDASMKTVLDMMMKRLSVLSMDPRPELRNSAMNSLFAATTANANLISGEQWKELFTQVVKL
jgi:hypothetical protein